MESKYGSIRREGGGGVAGGWCSNIPQGLYGVSLLEDH